MKEQRLQRLSKLTDEEKYKLTYKDFTVTEIEELIAETPMCDTDKRIAVARFIKEKPDSEIAEQEHMDTRTVRRHIEEIRHRLKITCIHFLVV